MSCVQPMQALLYMDAEHILNMDNRGFHIVGEKSVIYKTPSCDDPRFISKGVGV